MFVEINSLPDNARVWIYQANRPFSDDEVVKINELLKEFTNRWNDHGDGLKASFEVKYNQFITLVNDENHTPASGCTIDSSIQIIKKIEKDFEVDLLDRMKTAFKINNTINIVSLADFQKYVKENKINQDTIVFNNMVDTFLDYKNKWEVPAKDSWHSRYI